MSGNRCFKRQIGDCQKPATGLIDQLRKKTPNGAAPAPLCEPCDEIREYLSGVSKDREQRPEPGIAGQKHPADDQHQYQRWRDETAPQVIDDHPFAECRELAAPLFSICLADAPAQPGQELPVAAHPPVPALDIFQIGAGEALVEDDIGCQRGAAKRSFQQVVTQYRVFGDPSVDAAMECGNIIDALADENTDPKQVLIHIGNRAAVYIYRGIAGKKAGEKCPADTLRRHFDPWLKDRIAGDDITGDRIEAGDIVGMCQCTREFPDRSGRQHGVGVDRDDKSNP